MQEAEQDKHDANGKGGGSDDRHEEIAVEAPKRGRIERNSASRLVMGDIKSE
jgi:hypothetical protein